MKSHRSHSIRRRRLAEAAVLLTCVAACARLVAVDFIRGDINGDGTVSIADAYYYNRFYRAGGPEPPCWQAADADSDEDVDGLDAFRVLRYLFDGEAPPLAPFPAAGPPEPAMGVGGWLDCAAAGELTPLEDPVARLEVLDATAPGGADRLARIRVRLSSTGPIAGYSGRALVEPAVVAVPSDDGWIHYGIQNGIDLTHRDGIDPEFQGTLPADVWFSSTRVEGGSLRFAYLDPSAREEVIAGEDVDVLEIVVCLGTGTRAGVYPLALIEGELVDRDSARPIRPLLDSGTLTVLADVTEAGECIGETPPDAAQFVRGDANGDRRVSISDIHFTALWMFDLRAWPECWLASDVNDNGVLGFDDPPRLLAYLFGGDAPPPAPFPGPGPDRGENTPVPYDPPCGAYGTGSILEDPEARLDVLDAVAPGGNSSMVTLVVTVSSTQPTAALSGAIRSQGDILDFGGATHHSGTDLTRMREQGGTAPARMRDGRLELGYVRDIILGYDWLEAGSEIRVVELTACLQAGTKAGTYALTLEDGEITDARSGRAILPPAGTGTLTLLTDVAEGAVCPLGAGSEPPSRYEPPPPPPASIHLQYELIGGHVAPGDEIIMPFYIRADAGLQAYSFSIDFNEEVLEARAAEAVWQKPDGTRYDFLRTHLDNENEVPGGGGVAEGFICGAAVFSLTSDDSNLPPDRRNEVVRFRFAVDTEADVTSTEVSFHDRAPGWSGPVSNAAFAFGQSYTPETADSFLFVNGYVGVLPEISTFVRGDSNGDEKIDVSDAIRTLGWLFVGLQRPACYDAADADDSGKIDIADAVSTLTFLFAGGSSLPAPYPDPGEDATEDVYGCLRQYRR